jgi:glycosyltransferase involved in cell wall biosynthesis
MRELTNNAAAKINSVATIGNYLPRQCGIATFTTDLVQSLSPKITRCEAIAINDKPEGYDYPEKVRFEINQHNLLDYHTAARFLNINEFDLVCLQHEFGIFGGKAGSHILELLDKLHMPVVTTLHTVLDDPSPKYRSAMERLTDLSDRFVVMSQSAVNILKVVYDIPQEQIAYIPHGIPDTPFVDPNYYKEHFNLLGRRILLTFGLLSENKGIEYVLRGLPKVIEQFPDVIYIVLGATHPHVLEWEGEKYRESLQDLVKELGIERHVMFKNQFVPFETLCEYLSAADLYVTPYVNEDQITSGTLAYAMGTGKAVISTPYWYAEEMLSGGRGCLVPFKDDKEMADNIIDLFRNEAKRHQMRKRAYDFNRNATWEQVARQYLNTFEEVKHDYNQQPRPRDYSSLTSTNGKNTNGKRTDGHIPELKFDHLLALTDDTGMLQHAKSKISNRNYGYCTDDNARALIVAVRSRQISQVDASPLDGLFDRCLAFLLHAYNQKYRHFRNFMSYDRKWLESTGSDDSHGRALWALGNIVSLGQESSHLPLTSNLFMEALETAGTFQSPRSIAFTLLGIHAYLKTFPGDTKARRISKLLAGNLYEEFTSNASTDWPWLEEQLAYANAKLPHVLILAGDSLHREDMTQMGLEALGWLLDIQTEEGHLVPIGNQDWYKRGGRKSRFDQQPLEANALIEACIAAYHVTNDKYWLDYAVTCFNWFLGYNDLNIPLYDAVSGGCRDGLQSNGVNQNEGAESTLAWLLSLTSIRERSNDEILQPVNGQLITNN